MHPCAVLLGEVLTLSQLEEEALTAEDVEQAEDLALKRSELLNQAWKEREGYDEELLFNTLTVIQAMQERLMEIAGGMHREIGGKLRDTRKQGKYFSDYRHRKARSEKSLFFDKVS